MAVSAGMMMRHCWFNENYSRGVRPPRDKIKKMLAGMETVLRARGSVPVHLSVETWRMPIKMRIHDSDCMARITIRTAPGELHRSLVSWYEWQHPFWQWSCQPVPDYARIVAARPIELA